MENKKNSKKTVKLLVVLIALLLIACSLLGFTLARYVTQGNEGTGGADIAQWNIYDDDDEDAPSGEGSVRAMLSPKKDVYNGTNPRKNTVALADSKGFRITNESDVDAVVTLTITNGLTYYKNNGSGEEATTPTGSADTNPEWQNVTLSQIIHPELGEGENASNYDSFRVKVYKADGSEDTTDYTDQDQVDDTTVTYKITLDANGGYLEVLIGQITWTSDLQGETWTDEDTSVMPGDLRDTWIGENVGSVGFAYSWSAVQGSQLPKP